MPGAVSRPSVLVTSAGRRVQLVRFFREALARLDVPGRVLVVDMNPEWAAASRAADVAVRAPAVTDPDYEPFLLDLVDREGVGLLVPTLDTELAVLARLRGALAERGCAAVVSEPDLVATGRDKRRTAEWFRALGFETPETYPRDALRFPCFAKPYDGSLSKGAQALPTERALAPALLDDERMLFMEYFGPDAFDELSVDAYYADGGELRCLVPRKRVEVRGGEISKGVALKGPTYEYLCARLGHLEGARGCLTLQFFVAKDGSRCVASELNARFGGGYPLTRAAGADYPEWLVREYLLGESLPFFSGWCHGTAMTRYDDEFVFDAAEGPAVDA